MGFTAIGRMFVPKSKIFYDLFEDVVATVHQMAELLSVIVHEAEFGKRGVLIKQMQDLEHKNDEHTHKIFAELGRNFITPFDREDIHYLASALDDIADYIYSSAKKINFYKVNPNEATIHTMAGLILECCVQIKKAVLELRSMKNMRTITDALVIVNSIESQTDDIFDISVDRLFETEPDTKEVIKKREIYQVMETTTDKCEDAANAIESILIKNT